MNERTYVAKLTEKQLDTLADEIKLYRKFKGRGLKFVGITFDMVFDYTGKGSTTYENYEVMIKMDEMNFLNEYMIKKYGFMEVNEAAA